MLKKAAMVFGLFFLINQGVTAQESSCRGDRVDCPDLLNLPIEHYEWQSESSVMAQCGSFATACAKVMGDNNGLTRCVIHTLRYPQKKVLQHEMNHCRGWTHERQNYRRAWRPMFNE